MVIKPPPPTSPDNCKQQSIVNFGRKTKYTSRPFTKNIEESEDSIKEEREDGIKEERERSSDGQKEARPRCNADVKTEPECGTLSVRPIVVTPEIRQSAVSLVKLSPPPIAEKKPRRKKKKAPVKEEKE